MVQDYCQNPNHPTRCIWGPPHPDTSTPAKYSSGPTACRPQCATETTAHAHTSLSQSWPCHSWLLQGLLRCLQTCRAGREHGTAHSCHSPSAMRRASTHKHTHTQGRERPLCSQRKAKRSPRLRDSLAFALARACAAALLSTNAAAFLDGRRCLPRRTPLGTSAAIDGVRSPVPVESLEAWLMRGWRWWPQGHWWRGRGSQPPPRGPRSWPAPA